MQKLATRLRSQITPALVMFCALAICGSSGAAECSSQWLCIEEINSENGVELHAKNASKVPLTYTLRVSAKNFSADRPTKLTETIGPDTTKRVIVLTNRSQDQKGKYRFSVDWTVGNKDAAHDDEMLYQFPYRQGTSYRVLQGYGSRFSHTGLEQYAVDFKMDEGTPVHAARGGVVARIEESHSRGCWEDGCGKFANYIVILHDDETTGEYYHLEKNGVLVEPGQYVEAGEQIGLSGNTGHSTMPHLHFGVYRAVERGREQSIPVRFASAGGIVDRPRRGGRYLAVATVDAATARSASPRPDDNSGFVN